jgi:uncharacterized phage protein (TIGR01671 family)
MYPVSNIEWDLDGRIWVIADDGKNGIELMDEEAHLMRYTVLHDKNGREIYEGDIVNVHRVVLSPDDRIGWVEYTAQYGYSIRFGDRRCRQSDWATDEGAKYEVIGNIFDNPELLEEE